MKKPPIKRALPPRPTLAKKPPAARAFPSAQDPDSDPLVTELRRLYAEYANQLQQTLTAGRYTRCQGEQQQHMSRHKNPARR